MSTFEETLNWYIETATNAKRFYEAGDAEGFRGADDMAKTLAYQVRVEADKFQFSLASEPLLYMTSSPAAYPEVDQPIRYAGFAAKAICLDIKEAGLRHYIKFENDQFQIWVFILPNEFDALRFRTGIGVTKIARMAIAEGLNPWVFYPFLPEDFK